MSDNEKKKCGLVMPISAMDGYTEQHGSQIQSILKDAVSSIEGTDFETRMVSIADEVTVIHKTIVQNLHDDDIVICDVSGRNPNVMFELGIRLTFDKPTIIVKDDQTPHIFDSSPIEHVEYRRDLRHPDVEAFKKKLAGKVQSTLEAAEKDSDYSAFLKHFGRFVVPKLDEQEGTLNNVVLSRLDDLQNQMIQMSRQMSVSGARPNPKSIFTPSEYQAMVDRSEQPSIRLSWADRRMSATARSPHESIHDDGTLRKLIFEAIEKWSHMEDFERSSIPANLIADEDFLKFIDRQINGPLHFETTEDFLAAVQRRLNVFVRGFE